MRALRSWRKWVAVAAGILLVGVLATVSPGSPGSGITSTIFTTAKFEHAVHVNHDRVKFQTKEPTDVRVQKLEFAPGSFSGWHHHPGLLIVSVESGSVTLWESDCTGTTYGPGLAAGAVFVEGGDSPIQATSAYGAVNIVTYVVPRAVPPVFRIEDDPPPCAAEASL